MIQTNQLYKNNCNKELSGVFLGSCNKIDVIKIPIGVTVYIGLDEILDTKRDYKLDNQLLIKKDNNFAIPEKLYIHTIGTNDDSLELTLTTVGTDGKYFENIKKEVLQLSDTINQTLIDTKLANQSQVSFNNNLLSAMDKIINPYTEIDTIIGECSTASITEVFDSLLTCDKINLKLCPPFQTNGSDGSSYGGIKATLDGVLLLIIKGYSGNSGVNGDDIEIIGTKGKRLIIEHLGLSTTYKSTYALRKFNKKV